MISRRERTAWAGLVLVLLLIFAVQGASQLSIVGGLTGAGISPVSRSIGTTATYNTVTVAATGTGTQILAANNNRVSAFIQNMAAVTVYCATSTGITTSNAVALAPTTGSGTTITPGGGKLYETWTGLIQCLSASGNADVRYEEIAR